MRKVCVSHMGKYEEVENKKLIDFLKLRHATGF
jgi:hypothetical protein